MIISVGYRINSKRVTLFCQWATQVLREFAIKGFVLDNKRLENGVFLGVPAQGVNPHSMTIKADRDTHKLPLYIENL